MTKEADGTLTLTLENGEKMEGFDQVLVATGREPILDKLGLESAGVATDRGYITVRFIQSLRSPVNTGSGRFMNVCSFEFFIHGGWKASFFIVPQLPPSTFKNIQASALPTPDRPIKVRDLPFSIKSSGKRSITGDLTHVIHRRFTFVVGGAGGRLPEHERRRGVRGGRRMRQEGGFDFFLC